MTKLRHMETDREGQKEMAKMIANEMPATNWVRLPNKVLLNLDRCTSIYITVEPSTGSHIMLAKDGEDSYLLCSGSREYCEIKKTQLERKLSTLLW